MRTRPVILLALSVAAVLAILAAGVFALATRDREIRVTVHTSPKELNLNINDHDFGTIEDGTALVLTAGTTLDVTATHNGFEPYTTSVDIEHGQDTELTLGLLPVTAEAWQLLEDQDELEEERQATEDHLTDAETAYEQWPILSELPIEADTFRAYQGLSADGHHDFAIHLYLYTGTETAGRHAFQQWLTDHGHDRREYEIIEHIEAGPPPTAVPAPPTMDDLRQLSTSNVVIDEPDRHGLRPDELALLFATTTTTWDATSDQQPADSFHRATGLMTADRADTLETPKNPTFPDAWTSAVENNARSHSWPLSIDWAEADSGDIVYTIDTCWAWISDTAAPVLDGPRSYEITISKPDGSHAVNVYQYTDPDPFVDNNPTECIGDS